MKDIKIIKHFEIPDYNIINFHQIIGLINNEIRKRKIH